LSDNVMHYYNWAKKAVAKWGNSANYPIFFT
jgi:hypothetical protein